jgi:hypothetical protein
MNLLKAELAFRAAEAPARSDREASSLTRGVHMNVGPDLRSMVIRPGRDPRQDRLRMSPRPRSIGIMATFLRAAAATRIYLE